MSQKLVCKKALGISWKLMSFRIFSVSFYIVPSIASGSSLIPTTILYDDFAGSTMSSATWHIPTWQSPTDGTYVGRTQFRCTQNASLPEVSDSNALIRLDTYNPTGFSFYGTDLICNQTIPVGQGIIVTVVAKASSPFPGGIVGGIFLYHLKDGSDTLHDEIDFELLSNRPGEVQTNIYGNEPLGVGHPISYDFPTGSATDYHTYRIEWFSDSVSWYVDGTLVRTVTTESPIPSGPMAFHLNLWAPASDWPEAYNADLLPTDTPSENKIYYMLVDSVKIETLVPSAVLTMATSGEGVGTTDPAAGSTTAVATGIATNISATANEGFTFSMWTSSNANANFQNPFIAVTTVTLSGDSTVTAVFNEIPASTSMAVGKIYSLDISYVEGLANFARAPKAYCQTVNQKAQKINLKVAEKIKEAVTKLNLEWKSKIALLDRKVWSADKTKTCEEILKANPHSPLQGRLYAGGTDSDGKKVKDVDTGIDLMLNPPGISGIYDQAGNEISCPVAGQTIVVRGIYFGKSIPSVWLEYPDNKGNIRKLKLKVDRKSLIYQDYAGKPSCMDKDSGSSQFSATIPKFPRGWLAGQHNLVIDNKVCRATIVLRTE